MGREVREWYQAVSDRYYLICIIAIYHSVGKHATVTLATDTTAVAVIVTGRCSDKCDIDPCLAAFNGSYTAAMGNA